MKICDFFNTALPCAFSLTLVTHPRVEVNQFPFQNEFPVTLPCEHSLS